MKFRLSNATLKDLDCIHDYTVEKWGKEQAERYLAMIWSSFERIAESPSRWRLRPEIHPECRICFTGSHAILFRITDQSVEIARVLHDAMDFPRQMEDAFSA
jgi:toxin ParE1/3/4